MEKEEEEFVTIEIKLELPQSLIKSFLEEWDRYRDELTGYGRMVKSVMKFPEHIKEIQL